MLNLNPYLAEMGYATYAKTTDNKNYQGLPMPTRETLPAPQKTAWINAAAAIRRRVVRNGMSAEQDEGTTPVAVEGDTP